jgi:hypothetical protein
MLVADLLPKAVAHGPRLLPALIVRTCGRLVAGKPPLLDPTPTRSACPSHRLGGPHPGHPGPVAPLSQREGLLALRFLSPAPLLPRSVLPEPAQGRRIRALEPELRALQGALAGDLCDPSAVYRVMDTTLIAAIVRVRASEASKGLFCGQATFGRSASKTEWIYSFKVALVVDPSGVVTDFGLWPRRPPTRGPSGKPSWPATVTKPTWRTKGSRGCTGSVAGWRPTGRWWPPPPTRTLGGHGRRPIAGGRRESARS